MTHFALPTRLLLLTLTLASTAASQSLIAPLPGPPPAPTTPFGYGRAIALLDDLDGDGLRDPAIAVSEPVGWIRILSSDTGLPLRTIRPGANDDRSVELATIDDLDGDGSRDLIVGLPEHDSFGDAAGRVEVYSGRTARRLYAFTGVAGWRLGESVSAAGDIDLDGVPDIAAGAPRRSITGPGGGSDFGYLRIWSGANGTVLWQGTLSGADSRFGTALALLGDLDGDGRPSLAVGAPGAEAVFIVEPLGDTLPYSFNATGNGQFGFSLASIGDLDGDGRRDLIIGRPLAAPFLATNFAGAVSVHGSVSGAVLSAFGGTPGSNDRIGFDVAEAGDVDLDGAPDVIAGGAGLRDSAGGFIDGMLMVASGVDGSTLAPPGDSNGGDRAFALAEDADGDGRPDLWYGTIDSNGSLFRLGNAAAAAGGDALVSRANSGNAHGAATAVLDDLNSDGLAEVAVGVPHGAASGGVGSSLFILTGSGAVLDTISGTQEDELGASVAALGDLDGDGIGDFVVGRPNALSGSTRTGAAAVYSGATRVLIRQHFGQGFGDRCGASVASVPDTDGDGVDDYMVGSPRWTNVSGVIEVGRVQLFSGATGQQLLMRTGSHFLGRFGTSVAGTRDLDGDGRGDLLVGAPREWTVLSNIGAGRVRCYSGASGAELFSVVGSQAGMRLGSCVAALDEDVTGDGIPDLVAGAPWFGVVEPGDGRVELRSGADGALVWSDSGAFESRLGEAVLGLSDFDNDGVADFAVGETRGFELGVGERTGRVRLYSGATRVFYNSVEGLVDQSSFGSAIASGEDLDGDLVDDLVIGAPTFGAALGFPNGNAQTWTARSLGSDSIGTGTFGCNGPNVLSLLRPARIGQTMVLRFSEFTAGAVPVLIAGDMPSAVGTQVLGARLHLVPLFLLQLAPLSSGFGEFSLPIPNDLSLVGGVLPLQVLAVWPFTCVELPFPLSTTNALTVTFQ